MSAHDAANGPWYRAGRYEAECAAFDERMHETASSAGDGIEVTLRSYVNLVTDHTTAVITTPRSRAGRRRTRALWRKRGRR